MIAVGRSRGARIGPEIGLGVGGRPRGAAADGGGRCASPVRGPRRRSARSRSNAASSSTGPSFDSAPSFTFSPERSSAKSDSGPVGALGAEARLRTGDGRPRVELVGRLGVVGEDRGHRAGGRLGPVRQRRDFAGRRLVGRRRLDRRRHRSVALGRARQGVAASAAALGRGRRSRPGRVGKEVVGVRRPRRSERFARLATTTGVVVADATSGRRRRVTQVELGPPRRRGRASPRPLGLSVVGSSSRGSSVPASGRRGCARASFGAEDAAHPRPAGVRRRTDRSRVPHPRVLTLAG